MTENQRPERSVTSIVITALLIGGVPFLLGAAVITSLAR
jgi:hypothetical protein